MIGLMFLGAIVLWVLVSFMLGHKIPVWLKLKPIWAWLFVPLVFFAPVMDEVIALPQAYALCKQAEEAFWYDPAVKGGVLKYGDLYQEKEKIIGLNIKTIIEDSTSVLFKSNQPAIKRKKVYFSSGILSAPAGSSGGTMPLLLPEKCPSSAWSIPK